MGEWMGDVGDRLHNLEQRQTSVASTSANNTFPSIILSPSGGPVVVVAVPVTPPTGLVLAAGSFYDRIFLDASWTAPADGTATEYEVFLAKKVGSTYQTVTAVRTTTTNYRFDPVEANATYGVRVYAMNRIGRTSAGLPSNTTWTDIATGQDATLPGAISGLVAAAGVRGILVKWNDVTDPDVRLARGTYQIQVATDAAFTLNLQDVYDSATIVGFNNLASSTLYYYRVRAIDSSGNAGPWTATASVATGTIITTGSDIGPSLIEDSHVLNLSAAKVTFGTMSGDRINTNSLDANRIKADTAILQRVYIGVGGSVQVGNPPTTGLLINDQGISLYSGSVRKVFLDAVSGNGAFTGTISGSVITDGASYNYRLDSFGMYLKGNSTYSGARALRFVHSSDERTMANIRLDHNELAVSGSFVMSHRGIDFPATTGDITLDSSTFTFVGRDYATVLAMTSDAVFYRNLTVSGANFTVINGTKSFRIPHPLSENHDLLHASLEGPENGVYYRGEGRAVQGRAVVQLPDYFAKLTDHKDVTVLVTPVVEQGRNPVIPRVAASRVQRGAFEVRADVDCAFFWEVKARRADIDPLEVEPNDSLARQPPPEPRIVSGPKHLRKLGSAA